jgi:hypothetical protein
MPTTLALILQIFFALLIATRAFAEIEYTKIKGIHELLNEQSAHLSPIIGFTYLKQGLLENMRLFGNSGPLNPDFPCLPNAPEGIKKRLQKNNDCPADFTASLIQQLFPCADRTNFAPNSYPSDPVSKLTPALLGKIMRILSDVAPQDLADPTKRYALTQRLSKLFMLDSNLSSDPEDKRKLTELTNTKKEKLVTIRQLERLPQPCTLSQSTKIGHLKAFVASTNKELAALEAKLESKKRNKIKPEQIKPFIDALVGAINESAAPHPTYPTHNAQHVLLAFLWATVQKKQDFLDYFKELSPDSLSDQGRLVMHHSDAQTRFVTEAFPATDSTQDEFLSQFAHNPAIAMAYAYHDQLHLDNIPKALTYGTAHYTSKEGRTFEFSDCGETSLRNVFNIFLYDPETQTFDSKRLENLKGVNPQLIAFYNEFDSQAKAATSQARDSWTQIVSNLSADANSEALKINYQRPLKTAICEISAGVSNMTKVIDHLLLSSNSTTRHWTVADKLDYLTQAFSTDHRKFDWRLPSGRKTNINNPNQDTSQRIIFSLNEKDLFSWNFSEDHFSVESLTNYDNTELKQKIMKIIFPNLESTEAQSDKSSSSSSLSSISSDLQNQRTLSLAAPWFITKHNLRLLSEKLGPLDFIEVIYSLPLKYPEIVIMAISQAMHAYPTDPAIVNLCRILIEKLPSDYQAHERVMRDAQTAHIPFKSILPQPLKPVQRAVLARFAAEKGNNEEFNKMFDINMLNEVPTHSVSPIVRYLFQKKNLELLKSIALTNMSLRTSVIYEGLWRIDNIQNQDPSEKLELTKFIKALALEIQDPGSLGKLLATTRNIKKIRKREKQNLDFLSNTPIHNKMLAFHAMTRYDYELFIKAIEQGAQIDEKTEFEPDIDEEPLSLFEFALASKRWKMLHYMLHKYPDVLTPEQAQTILTQKPQESQSLEEWTTLVDFIRKHPPIDLKK